MTSEEDLEALKKEEGERLEKALENLVVDTISRIMLGEKEILTEEETETRIKVLKALADQGDETALECLGVIYWDKGSYTEAIDYFRQAAKKGAKKTQSKFKPGFILEAKAFVYFNSGKYQSAIEAYTQLINEFSYRTPSEIANAYYFRGQAHEKLGNYLEAVGDFNQMVTLDPRFSAYFSRGGAHFELEKYQEALDDYNEAIKLSDEDGAYYMRCRVKEKMQDISGALKDINKAIELNSTFAGFHKQRGDIYLELQNPEEALKNFNQAIILNPKYFVALVAIADVQFDLQDFKNAFETFSKIITNFSNDLKTANLFEGAYERRGLCSAALNNYDQAITDFNYVISLDDKYPGIYLVRAECYFQLKKDKEALGDYNQAIRLDNENALAYFERGRFFINFSGKEQQAIEDFTKAIELIPMFEQAYYLRGCVRKNLKNYSLATEDLKHVEKDSQLYETAKRLIDEIKEIQQKQQRQSEPEIAVKSSSALNTIKTEEIKKTKVYAYNPPAAIFHQTSDIPKKEETEPLLSKKSQQPQEKRDNKEDSCSCTLS